MTTPPHVDAIGSAMARRPGLRTRVRWRFCGHILGVGTASGTRIVVGIWPDSPLGAFADVMVERADGHRLLLADRPEVAAFVTGTYSFDEVVLVPAVRVDLDARRGGAVHVDAGPLALTAGLGARTALGWALRAVPSRAASHPAFTALSDPVARVLLHGVRTRGTAGGARREHYGATDLRAVTTLAVSWDGTDLGGLRDVDPPARFGFSSTPRRPGLTRVVTTVVEGPGRGDGACAAPGVRGWAPAPRRGGARRPAAARHQEAP